MKGHDFDALKEYLRVKGYNVFGASEPEILVMYEED